MDLQAELDLVEAGKDDCQTPRRPLEQALSPTGTQQHQPSTEGTRHTGDNNDLTSDMTWLTTTEDTSKWDAMESDVINSRLRQPARPTTSTNTTSTTQPTTHVQTTYTTNAHDQNEDDTKDDDDDALLVLSRLLDGWASAKRKQRQLAHSFKKKEATRISHDTLILSVTHLLPCTDARPLYSAQQKDYIHNVFQL